MQPRPPSSPSSGRFFHPENTKLRTNYTLTQEDQHAAHGTLALLWRKVRAQSDWHDHIQSRENSLQRHRATSAKRAASVRQESVQHTELVGSQKEKIVQEKAHSRLIIKKDESVAHEEKDLRKIPSKKRKRKEKSKEELDEISQQWVTVGKGAYYYSDLDNPVYLRSMQKAELELHKQKCDREMKAKQSAAAEIRRNEREIMQKKAGVTARYNLPAKAVPMTNGGGDDEEASGEEGGGEEGAKKKRVREPRAVRLDRKREHQLLERKTGTMKKDVDADIDAAAKLLILHAHLIRRACVEAKATAKAGKEGEEGEKTE